MPRKGVIPRANAKNDFHLPASTMMGQATTVIMHSINIDTIKQTPVLAGHGMPEGTYNGDAPMVGALYPIQHIMLIFTLILQSDSSQLHD